MAFCTERILHYYSGEEIKPGDEVKCTDGKEGKVSFLSLGGPVSIPGFLPFTDRFFVTWNDGATNDYPPSDPSVKLLSRPVIKRMTSPTMHLTIKKAEFLECLQELGSHSLYYPGPLSKQLAECGLSTSVSADSQGLIVEGQLIPLSTPEWGEPGISTLSVLGTIYELATGEPPHSQMNGRGFWFHDVMNKLATHWGLEAKYP